MSFQIYDTDRNVVDAIADVSINPDLGKNNPFRTGTLQGNYTIKLVFGPQPFRGPAPNTIYTGKLNLVALGYRIYYSNNPNDLPGGPVTPVLPNVIVGDSVWTSCPPRPILPEESTLSGRLDDIDYVGIPPANKPRLPQTPAWIFSVTNPLTPFFPSQDNAYMSAAISRDFLRAPYNYDMVVIRMKTPTFTNTQAGVPPYAPANMRFWSMWMTADDFCSAMHTRQPAATINGASPRSISVLKGPATRFESVKALAPTGALLPTDII